MLKLMLVLVVGLYAVVEIHCQDDIRSPNRQVFRFQPGQTWQIRPPAQIRPTLNIQQPTFTSFTQLPVVLGSPSTEGKYPWMVFIELNNGDNRCGGTLISNQWVLTAAHCLLSSNPTKILLGTLKNDGTDPDAVTRQMAEKCCHKDFDASTMANDICLMKLNSPVNFGTKIQPLSLPPQNKLTPDGTTCTVMGWGLNEHDQLLPGLQEADVFVINKHDCKTWYSHDHVTIPDDHICAGHVNGGPDTCGGDSGGPLVTYDENDEYFVLGITSFGPSDCGLAKRPGVYTKVSSYTSWIQNKMTNPCSEPSWTSWTTTCTVTCGTGSKIKRRKCQDELGNDVSTNKCPGTFIKYGTCTKPPCKTYNWGSWTSECSVTCGTGVLTKRRQCLDQYNKITQDKYLCHPGSDEEKGACYKPPCATYSWTSWKITCGVTCGTGTETRTRKCLDGNGNDAFPTTLCGHGPATEHGTCQKAPCTSYNWGSWSSECSVTCGTGVLTKTRKCLDQNNNIASGTHLCYPGSDEEKGTCYKPPCTSYSWSAWKITCSVTCGTGVETRTRKCLDKDGDEVYQTALCGPEAATEHGVCQKTPCTSHQWGPWNTACSVTCGSGIETKRRKCLDDQYNEVPTHYCHPGQNFKKSICQLPPCKADYYWGPWKTHCQVTCGKGSGFQIRQCLNKNGFVVDKSLCKGDDIKRTKCNLNPCKPTYNWGKWSESCSVTCGKGISFKVRRCLNQKGNSVNSEKCPGPNSKRGICQEPPCTTYPGSSDPYWGQWKSWSNCRVKTYIGNKCNGFKSATRDCLYNYQDVDPNQCVMSIGGDFYKEVRCRPYDC